MASNTNETPPELPRIPPYPLTPCLDVYALEIEGHKNPVTQDHILIAANILYGNPTLTLAQAGQELGAKLRKPRLERSLELTILESVRTILMFNCPREADEWKPSERFVDFASRCFPTTPARSVAPTQRSMKAWKLNEKYGLSFSGTDDLARHLYLDLSHPAGPTLFLFRHGGFIKKQLDGLKQATFQEDDGIPVCLKRYLVTLPSSIFPLSRYLNPRLPLPNGRINRGYLPPRLLFETLHSIQEILFHFNDRGSRPILKRLIAKDGFDKSYATAEGYKGYKFFDDEDGPEYRYWGERLEALYTFTRQRLPRNKFERWMKWQASDGNAFALALAALLISIVVGILSLGLAALQSWIAWEAWKEPVSNGGSDDETTALLREIVELLRRQQQQGQ